MKDFGIFLMVVGAGLSAIFVLVLVLLIPISIAQNVSCNQKWEGYPHKYSIWTRCMVKLPNTEGYVPESRVWFKPPE